MSQLHQIGADAVAAAITTTIGFAEIPPEHIRSMERDPTIDLPYDEVITRTADGIPNARPEIVLLFKAEARAREGPARP